MRDLILAAVSIMGLSLAETSAPALAQSVAPGYGAPISLAKAKAMLSAAEAEAMKNNWQMVVVVVDSAGHLVALSRMDDAQLGSVEVAVGKAVTSINFKRPTKVVEELLQRSPRLLTIKSLTAIEGGFPIVLDGKIVGAIGASGGASQQDAQVAQAGLAAFH